jgi:hypothetical protein
LIFRGLKRRKSVKFSQSDRRKLDTQKYYDELMAKLEAEALTPDEHSQLLGLTEQIEKLQAGRIEYLVELARLRKTSLTALMENLGIQIPVYV